MNQANATYSIITSRKAIVDLEYRFENGKLLTGFSTVEVSASEELYDACYARAEALSQTQSCRLETFKLAEPKFRVHFTSFNYFSQEEFKTKPEAIAYAKSKCFDATIHQGGVMVASYSVLSGVKDY